MNLSLNKVINVFLLLAFIIALLVLARPILMPLAYGILLSIAALPLVKFFERKGVNKFFSILFSLLALILIISALAFLAGYVISDIYQDIPSMRKRVIKGIGKLNENIQEITGLTSTKIEDKLQNNIQSLLQPAFSLAKDGIKLSLLAIGNILLVLIYMVLLLYYRSGIKRVLFKDLGKKIADKRRKILNEVKEIVHGYFYGMLLVMLILGVLNTVSLWIIGVDYPYFWGFLAGTLVIIPYIGTALGGLFPLLYTLGTSDDIWKPVAVIITYAVIQQIEGNFITPKVLGSQIDLNMLTIILSMLIGAFIWGIAGIIISVPLVGILHILFVNYDEFKKFGEIMSADITKN